MWWRRNLKKKEKESFFFSHKKIVQFFRFCWIPFAEFYVLCLWTFVRAKDFDSFSDSHLHFHSVYPFYFYDRYLQSVGEREFWCLRKSSKKNCTFTNREGDIIIVITKKGGYLFYIRQETWIEGFHREYFFSFFVYITFVFLLILFFLYFSQCNTGIDFNIK